MTLDGKNVKKTMKTPSAYPRVSILDPRYTETLSRETTVSTALDAFCHCAESYLSPKSTDISRMFAVDGAKKIYNSLDAIDKLGSDADDPECLKLLRYGLMTGANAGGIAINTTGTGFNHPLGYNLTLYKGIPHGRACGAFMSAYYYYNRTTELGAKLIDDFCDAIGVEWAKVAADIVRWSDVKIGSEYGNALTPDEIELYVNNVKGAGNYKNSPYVINPDKIRDTYQNLFGWWRKSHQTALPPRSDRGGSDLLNCEPFQPIFSGSLRPPMMWKCRCLTDWQASSPQFVITR